MTLAKAKASTN